jgi:AcrR family transcriptional regulator
MKTTRPYAMTSRAEAVVATRERIVRSATALFLAQRFEDVTLAAIARGAGVSHQTVLNHFESKQGVARAVAVVLAEESSGLRGAEPGDHEGAVHALVDDYERMGDANFGWAASDGRDGLAELMDEARAGHREWLARMFADRLPASGPARRRAIDALHAATDVYVWKLLRRDLGRSRAETEETMNGLVAGVLEGTDR